MYFIILEVAPERTNPEYEQFGGAFAACWVATDDPEVAEREAREVLADAGWATRAVDEHYPVDRERYLGNEDALRRFDQAIADGLCINLNTWPRKKRKAKADQAAE
jgi:hypothetical protein